MPAYVRTSEQTPLLSQTPLEISDVVGDVAADTWATNPVSSVLNIFERTSSRQDQQSPMMSKEEVMAQAEGFTFHVPDRGMRRAEFDLIMGNKRRERELATRLAAVPDSKSKTAATLLTAFGVSALDPINLAAGFIPVVGQARYASQVAKAQTRLGRAGVRARTGAIEGAAGAAVVEPLVILGQRAVEGDYTMMDSLLNIAIGSALGATLHSGFGLAKDAFRGGAAKQTINAVESSSPAAQEAASRVSIARVAEGYDPQADVVLNTDPTYVHVQSRGAKGIRSEALNTRAIEVADELKAVQTTLDALRPLAAVQLTRGQRKAEVERLRGELQTATRAAADLTITPASRGGPNARQRKRALETQRQEFGRVIANLEDQIRGIENAPTGPRGDITALEQQAKALETEAQLIGRAQRRIARGRTPELDGIHIDNEAVVGEVAQSRQQFVDEGIRRVEASTADQRTMLYNESDVARGDEAFSKLTDTDDIEAVKAEIDELLQDAEAAAQVAGLEDQLNDLMAPVRQSEQSIEQTRKIASTFVVCRNTNG